MAEFQITQVLRAHLNVTDDAGIPIDPSILSLKVKRPNGQIDDISAAVVRESVGIYRADYTPDAPGSYYFRWESIGNGAGCQENGVYVFPSQFVN